MHPLLKNYQADVAFPGGSGAEHLEMLRIRDRLWKIESTLSQTEKETLSAADQQLIRQASEFYQELCQFIDLAAQRREKASPAEQWWWYLDVLAQLPSNGLKMTA